LVEARKQIRRKSELRVESITRTFSDAHVSQSHVATPHDYHEFSDEEEDMDTSNNGPLTLLDAISSGRRGLDAHGDNFESPKNDTIEDVATYVNDKL
jgi:hypothetical protein